MGIPALIAFETNVGIIPITKELAKNEASTKMLGRRNLRNQIKNPAQYPLARKRFAILRLTERPRRKPISAACINLLRGLLSEKNSAVSHPATAQTAKVGAIE